MWCLMYVRVPVTVNSRGHGNPETPGIAALDGSKENVLLLTSKAKVEV